MITESNPTLKYSVSHGKQVDSISVGIKEAELPYVVLETNHERQFSVPLLQKDAQIYHEVEKNLVRSVPAKKVFVEVPDTFEYSSWVLPLFYYNNSPFGIPFFTLSENLITPNRKVQIVPESSSFSHAKNMLSVLRAVQYFQTKIESA
jgi:hypothetical protein